MKEKLTIDQWIQTDHFKFGFWLGMSWLSLSAMCFRFVNLWTMFVFLLSIYKIDKLWCDKK